MAELGQSLGLQLANPFAVTLKWLPTSSRVRIRPSASPKRMIRTSRSLGLRPFQGQREVLLQEPEGGGIGRHLGVEILDEVGEGRFLFLPDWSLERDRVLGDPGQFDQPIDRQVQLFRQFLGGRFPSEDWASSR